MSLIKDWNDFWFAPRSARPLGLMRIVFGIVAFTWAVSIGPNVMDWFSEQGVLPLRILHDPLVQQGPRLDLLTHVTSPVAIYALLVVLMISSISLALGYQTRLSAIITWALLVTFHHRNPFVFSSADTLMRMDAFYLMLAPCGRSLSLDRMIEKSRNPATADDPELVESWGQRLIQVQLCMVYACSFLAKIPGNLWTNGTALYYPMHMPELLRFPTPFIGSNAVLIYLFTMLTLGIELSLCTLIWIRPLRKYILTAGIMLHLGIEYALNVPYFTTIIICTYIVFMPDDWLDRIEAVGRRLLPGGSDRFKFAKPPTDDGLNREERRSRKRQSESAQTPVGR